MKLLKIKNSDLKWIVVIFIAVCYAGFINLETSPFRYFVLSKPFSACLNNQLQTSDNYVYLYTSNLILKGKMPYLHSFDHKGPVFYLLVAAGIRIGSIAGVWLVQFIFLFITAFYAYRSARLLVSRPVATLAAVFTVLWYSRQFLSPEMFSVPFLFISFYFFARYLLTGFQISLAATYLTGICFGIVALQKLNLTTLWMVFIAEVILISIIKGSCLFLVRRTIVFLSGTASIVIPVLMWIYVKGAFPDFVSDYWDFNLNSYGETPTVLSYMTFFLPIRPHDLKICHWLGFCWLNTPALLFFLFMAFRAPSKELNIFYVSLSLLFVVSVLFFGMSGRVYRQYSFCLIEQILIFVAVSTGYIVRLGMKRKVTAAILFLLLAVPIIPSFFLPVFKEQLRIVLIKKMAPEADVSKYGYPFRTDRADIDLASWIAANTEDGDTINGEGFRVYWYADRVCASKNSCNASHSYERTFVKDESGNYPAYIFERRKEYDTLRTILFPPPEEKKIRVTSPEIEETLSEKYEKVYSNDLYDLYHRK